MAPLCLPDQAHMRVLDFRLYSEMREPDPKANHKWENIFFVANAGSEVQSLQFAIGVCVGEASSHIIHLASLFGAFLESQKRLVITRYLASPSTRARALGLLAMTGSKERAGLVLPLLEREMSSGESIEAGVQQAAVGALSHIGDCSAASRVKALLGNPWSDLRTSLSLLLYLWDCVVPPKQNVLGSVLLRQAGGPFGAYQVLEIADAFRAFSGPSAIPALVGFLKSDITRPGVQKSVGNRLSTAISQTTPRRPY